MLGATILLAVLLAAAALWAQQRDPALHRQAAVQGVAQLRGLLLVLPVALIAAGFLGALIPEDKVVALVGGGSGLRGILIASVIGSILPGGPMVTFPIVVVLFDAGAGTPQMVALLTSWSVLALHRVLAFEIPLVGVAFSLRRVVASLLLPPVAGVLSAGLLLLF